MDLGYTFLLIIVIFQDLVYKSISENQNYKACGRVFQCGNLQNLGYPFWGDDRPHYCGHPSFRLTNCNTNRTPPMITINSSPYRVLSVNSSTPSLKLVRDDYWSNMCSYPKNTTVDEPHFNYGNGTTDMILYWNCYTGWPNITRLPNQFNCIVNGITIHVFYALSGARLPKDILNWESSVSIRVDEPRDDVATYDWRIIRTGFGLVWDANNIECDKCVRSGGRCGSNWISGSFVCHTHGTESFQARFRPFRIGFLLIILVIGLLMIMIMIIAVWCLLKFRQRYSKSSISENERPEKDSIEAIIRIYSYLAPKRYTYSKVKKMTNSFREKLGQGGFGAVYKGKLPDGRQVAVKILNESKANGEDFFNEVASIGRTSHINVVTLLGFCLERKKRALIYEYMVRGSLDKAIHEKLEWTTLHHIAIGVARGLEYLHRGCNTRIVHFDIKPHNILLDQNFRPKISDFGLAKLCQSQQSKISMLGARGTAGYIAPEVFSRAFGCVSHKSDVYSYGMLLIEMTGAEKKKLELVQTSDVYFPDWIYTHLEQDKDLEFDAINNQDDEEIAKKMLIVGLWCIQGNPSDRPSISKVVELLEGNHESLQVPPKPQLFSHTRTCLSSGTSSSSVSNALEIQETKVQSSKIVPVSLQVSCSRIIETVAEPSHTVS